MSKRHGRNQKRKMRIAFAELELDKKMLLHEIAQKKEHLKIIESEMRIAKELATKMSVLFSPEEKTFNKHDQTGYIELLKSIGDPFSSDPLEIDYKRYTLPVLISYISKDILSDSIHVNVEYGLDKKIGYAISINTLLQVGKKHAANMISEQLTRMLVDELYKAKL